MTQHSFQRSIFEKYGLMFDCVGLIVCGVLIHLVYIFWITPQAQEAVSTAELLGDVPARTLPIILKDIEQQACLTLTLWCLWLWVLRYRLFQNDGYLLELDILHLDKVAEQDSKVSTIDFVEERLAQLRSSLKDSQLINAIDLAVRRIRLNGNFQEANDIAMEACDLHLELLNSKLSISRYILWAIPSIGFLGTVRGISQALSKANEAMAGDISGVGASLGVAFNSTWVALFLSLILMLISNSLHGREERLVAQFKSFVSSTFIPVLSLRMNQPVGSEPAKTSEEFDEHKDSEG
ncbi:MAG: MotA/TolQ/ExbB proton channel family protein [Gammaproteobacteria bacterium]|nr:MotA/TolQ/ExbB proton channel family protein [Gammaproteobacteria bacterium]